MNSIDPSLYLSNQTTDRAPSADLGKDGFLKILMTQLQNQDPTNPMKDQEFVSQMASFSSLEQMMNMTNSIDSLVQNQTVSPILKNSHMIGKEVSYQAYDEETGEKLGIETSNVTAVSQREGWAVLELENGEKIYADSITQVSDPDANSDSGTEEEEITGPAPEGSE